jgi:NAD-dependent dihydropyrimidine dehydrogenase PreA subunit
MPVPEAFQEYAKRLVLPGSATLYRIFEILFDTEDKIKLMGALPGSVGELAERTGLPESQLQELTQSMFAQGAIARKDDRYRLFPALIELRDAAILWSEASQEMFDLWHRVFSHEMPNLLKQVDTSNIPAGLRTIAIEQAVESHDTVLDIDSARKVFEEAEIITVVPCACRLQASKAGEGHDCPAPDVGVCMQTNKFARAAVDRGIGEQISSEEALKRIAAAEEAGLVHMMRNNVKDDMFMCNCCPCCCAGFQFFKKIGDPFVFAPSRFRVAIDVDECTGCGICEDRCHFDAISVEDVAEIDLDKCFGCGNCVIKCEPEALTLVEVRPREHIRVT